MKHVLSMAPIQGLTNCVYRNTYTKFFSGFDSAVTPFIASRTTRIIRRNYLREIWPERNQFKGKLVPQILGNNAKDFIILAQAIFDLGYESVNWNLGCPMPMVRNRGRGSGLLSSPEKIEAVLNEVLSRIPNKLSLKVRLGRNDHHDLPKLLPLLNQFPLEEIIIHPRTGKQMYSGTVDWDSFEQCLTLTKHPVVYNGDINSLEIFHDLTKRFPSINRWMLGRGAVMDPFLPEMIKQGKPLSDKERTQRFIAFHNALTDIYLKELYGPAHFIDKMKSLWLHWGKGFGQDSDIYQKICRLKTVEKYFSEVDAFFKF